LRVGAHQRKSFGQTVCFDDLKHDLSQARLGHGHTLSAIGISMHAVRAMQDVLSALSRGDTSFAGNGVGFEEYNSIVGFDRWADIENRYS
jgi:hypothetical protein